MSAAHSKWAALALIFTIPLFLYALFLLIVSAQGFSVNFIGYQLPRWTDSDSIETGIRIGFLVAGVAGVLSGTCSMLTIAFCFRKHFYISTPFKLFLVPAMVTLLSGLAFMGFGIYAISTREDGHAWVVVTVMGAVLLGFIGGVLLGLTMLHRDRSGVKLQPYKRPSVEEMRVHSDGTEHEPMQTSPLGKTSALFIPGGSSSTLREEQHEPEYVYYPTLGQDHRRASGQASSLFVSDSGPYQQQQQQQQQYPPAAGPYMNTDNQRTSWTSQNHSHGSYPPAAQAPLYNPSPSYNNSLPIAPKDPNNSALYVPTATTESDVAAQYSYPHHTAYPSYSPHDDPSSFPIPTPQAPHSSPYPDDDPPQAYPLPQTPSYSPETPTVIAPSPSFYREELPLPSTTSSHPVITTTTTTQETDVDSMMADAGSFLGPPPPPQQSRPTSSLQTWRVPEKAVPHHRPVDQ